MLSRGLKMNTDPVGIVLPNFAFARKEKDEPLEKVEDVEMHSSRSRKDGICLFSMPVV